MPSFCRSTFSLFFELSRLLNMCYYNSYYKIFNLFFFNLYSMMNSIQCTSYNVYIIIYSMMNSIQRTSYNVYIIIYSMMNSIQCTSYNVYIIIYSMMNSIQCTSYNVYISNMCRSFAFEDFSIRFWSDVVVKH